MSTKILALFAANVSRDSWVYVDGAWRQIEDTNFDCVTNMTELAATAHAADRFVDYNLDGNGKITAFYVW